MKMRMFLVFVLVLVQTVRSADVDVERRLAEYDARFAQLEKERKEDKEIIQMLKQKITHVENERQEDKEIIQTLKLQIMKLEQFQRQKEMGKQLQSGFMKSPQTRVPGFAPTAFTACMITPPSQLGVFQTIVFERVITNVGNAYNPHNGEFTAPVNGVYAFHATLMTEGHTDAYFQIVKDGQMIDDMYVDATLTNELRTTGEFWLLNLNAGSQVWLRTEQAGETMHGGCHTMFSGFFVFEV